MAIPLLAAIAAAGSFAQGASKIGAGYLQGRSYAAQALGAEIERDNALLRRTQIGERSRQDLATMLGNIDAVRMTRGSSLDSQTGQLIQRRTVEDAYRDEAVAVLAELNRASNASMQAKGFRTAARWAVPLSVLDAAGSFAQGASYLQGGG